MSATAATYTVTARTRGDGTSVAKAKTAEIIFDSSPKQGDGLPSPADLLTAAFAACMLKNVERFGEVLHFDWHHASVDVVSERQDSPPQITRITYRLEVVTDEAPHRVELLHKNLTRHGTIFNTLAKVSEVSGEVVAIAPPS